MTDPVLTGSCHCGQASWRFEGDPGNATACNCTVDRRYGALWIYDYLGERVHIAGELVHYVRADSKEPYLEWLFCPNCHCVVAWRGLRPGEDGKIRAAVNVRLAEPKAVGHLIIDHFDGLDTFEDLPSDGKCVHDLWA
jgi:hypothetical protein